MKLLCLVGILAFTALGAGAYAVSAPPTEILPGQPRRVTAFDISSERLSNGDVRFTVTFDPISSFSLADYRTSLGIVKIEERAIGMSMSSHILRALASEQKDNHIQCAFSVTQKELEDPDLSFVFGKVEVQHVGFHFPHFQFARLRNFLPR